MSKNRPQKVRRPKKLDSLASSNRWREFIRDHKKHAEVMQRLGELADSELDRLATAGETSDERIAAADILSRRGKAAEFAAEAGRRAAAAQTKQAEKERNRVEAEKKTVAAEKKKIAAGKKPKSKIESMKASILRMKAQQEMLSQLSSMTDSELNRLATSPGSPGMRKRIGRILRSRLIAKQKAKEQELAAKYRLFSMTDLQSIAKTGGRDASIEKTVAQTEIRRRQEEYERQRRIEQIQANPVTDSASWDDPVGPDAWRSHGG